MTRRWAGWGGDRRSNAHGHDHVFEVGVVGNGEQGRAVAVAELQVDHLLGHIAQHFNQVGDVEADLDHVAAVINVEFVNRFFLLGVAGGDTQGAGFYIQAHTFELVAGQDGGALQRGQQGAAT